MQHTAYAGSEFVVEWYFDEQGKSQALAFFNRQPLEKKRKLLNLLRLIGDHGKIFDESKFRNEGNGIYAFKPQPDRYLCFFFEGKKIIITNAFIKKCQKLPLREKDTAVKAHGNYKNRIKEGSYYEKKS